MSDFKRLLVWQKAHAMALNAHRVAGRIRKSDDSALRNQIMRAALSVPANIVEGCGQESAKQFSRFLLIALNSTTELEYHFIAARDLGIIPKNDSLNLLSEIIEVRKMLHGLRRTLAARSATAPEHKASS